jgi:hypothetical protein
MSDCKNCGTCVYWERNWMNAFEGYCAARVEITDMKFKCEDYGPVKHENHAEAVETSVGGMV